MVSVGAAIYAQPPLASTSVSSISVGVQVSIPAVPVFHTRAATQVPFPVMHASVATQVTFPAMSASEFFYSTGASPMARQIPFPVVPSPAPGDFRATSTHACSLASLPQKTSSVSPCFWVFTLQFVGGRTVCVACSGNLFFVTFVLNPCRASAFSSYCLMDKLFGSNLKERFQ